MTRTLRILDVCCSLGGATRAFRDAGHEVVGIEIDPEIAAHADDGSWHELIVADVRDVSIERLIELGPFDLVWASPPCQTFSKLAIRWYWNGDGTPGDPLTWERIALVYRIISLIQRLDPRAWVMENPAGKMRHLEHLSAFERRTVTYCQYGHFLRKETDLWGGFPPTLDLATPCRAGDGCHTPAPRHSDDHTYGKPVLRDGFDDDSDLVEAWRRDNGNRLPDDTRSSALRSLVPHDLSEALCEAMEAWTEGHWRDHSARHATEQLSLTEVVER